MISLLALLLGLLALPSAARGAGELDPSFDGDGRVVTDFGPVVVPEFGPFERVFDTAIQADGKIVAAGVSDTGANPGNFALARYNPDGSLDASFDGDGRVVTDFGAFETANGVAIQADGKIVAAGETHTSGPRFDFALARYNPDGSLDASFDGDGRVVTDFEAGDDFIAGVAVQADGKIVAAGSSQPGGGGLFDFALARYNPDGSLDASFDGDGRAVTDLGAGNGDFAHGVAIEGDGKIVAGGSSGLDFALARYNPDGSLDASFDGDGRVVTDFGTDTEALAVATEADGKIVAAGSIPRRTARQPAVNFDFALARYNPDGSLDASFDGDGRAVTDFGADEQAVDVAIQADGKIVAAGITGAFDAFCGDPEGSCSDGPFDFALARYNPDSSLDASFDGDGRVVTDFGADDAARAVAIQADGKLVAAGDTNTGEDPLNYNFALARYLPDGAPVNLPPDCSTVAVSPNTLRPPNRRFRLVTLSGATDPDGDTVTLTITAVTQDEPLKSPGGTAPDARAGSESNEVLLRAERSGRGDGRVYRVTFTGSDGEGGGCAGTVAVSVPRNMGAGSTAIDSAPPSFDSFGP